MSSEQVGGQGRRPSRPPLALRFAVKEPAKSWAKQILYWLSMVLGILFSFFWSLIWPTLLEARTVQLNLTVSLSFFIAAIGIATITYGWFVKTVNPDFDHVTLADFSLAFTYGFFWKSLFAPIEQSILTKAA